MKFPKQLMAHCCAAITLLGLISVPAKCFEPLDYRIQVDTVLTHDDGSFLWYHPRTAPLPGFAPNGGTAVVMTLVRLLNVSDYYSGTYVMRTDDLGHTWSSPAEPPNLAWRKKGDVDVAVCDATPGWHSATRKLLLVGAQVRYGSQGEQLEDIERSNQTAYSVYDPQSQTWSNWNVIEMPSGEKFNYARSACAQWLTQDDGKILLPFYFGTNANAAHRIAVVQCSFDGKEVKYIQHGNELTLPEGTGLCEPSLAHFDGRYYLTIRSDLRAFVTTSVDGLHFEPIQPWQFDDGSELGSYNTQQHWLVHSDGLFLLYTRRGASNDHVFRHRAPLFMAQVDPSTRRVVRNTERVLIPERGADMGNFGAAAIDKDQSWVTVSEGVQYNDARQRGAVGATFVARIYWSKPNQLFDTAASSGKANH